MRKRKSLPKGTRHFIWGRDRGICGICGDPVEFNSDMEIDHIARVAADRGTDDESNLRATHRRCNQSRIKVPRTKRFYGSPVPYHGPKPTPEQVLARRRALLTCASSVTDLELPHLRLRRESGRWRIRVDDRRELSFQWSGGSARDIRVEASCFATAAGVHSSHSLEVDPSPIG